MKTLMLLMFAMLCSSVWGQEVKGPYTCKDGKVLDYSFSNFVPERVCVTPKTSTETAMKPIWVDDVGRGLVVCAEGRQLRTALIAVYESKATYSVSCVSGTPRGATMAKHQWYVYNVKHDDDVQQLNKDISDVCKAHPEGVYLVFEKTTYHIRQTINMPANVVGMDGQGARFLREGNGSWSVFKFEGNSR